VRDLLSVSPNRIVSSDIDGRFVQWFEQVPVDQSGRLFAPWHLSFLADPFAA
jgi:hypothetical protein